MMALFLRGELGSERFGNSIRAACVPQAPRRPSSSNRRCSTMPRTVSDAVSSP